MNENNFSRSEATQILSELKCMHDSKAGLPPVERLLWLTLINKFEGILPEIEEVQCPDDLPAAFKAFLSNLNW